LGSYAAIYSGYSILLGWIVINVFGVSAVECYADDYLIVSQPSIRLAVADMCNFERAAYHLGVTMKVEKNIDLST